MQLNECQSFKWFKSNLKHKFLCFWIFFLESLLSNISIESCLLRSEYPHDTHWANFNHLISRFVSIIIESANGSERQRTFCQIPCKLIFGLTKLNRLNCCQIGLHCKTHTLTTRWVCHITGHCTQNNPFLEHFTRFVHRSRYAQQTSFASLNILVYDNQINKT